MKEEINEYYSKFREIYTKENYPEWFKFKDEHNEKEKFGELGYRCKCRFCPGSRINQKSVEHELGHYAILQTPLYKDIKIVIVGNNNSWFDDKCGEKALDIAKSLKEKVPDRNFLTEGGSGFSRTLVEKFTEVNAGTLLRNNTVGLNRTWLQTGGSSQKISQMKERKIGVPSLVDLCHKWTEDIVRIINPQLLLLLGEPAKTLFNSAKGREHENGRFYIQGCRHPTVGGQNDFKIHLEEGLQKSGLAI